MRDRWTYALAAVSAMGGIGAALCAGATEWSGNVITVVHPWVVYGTMGVGWFSWATLVVLLLTKARDPRKGVLAMTLSFVALAGSSGFAFLLQRTQWCRWDTDPNPHEPRLVALTAGFVDHSTVMADEAPGVFASDYLVIGTEPSEGPSHAPFLVRSRGLARATGVVARNGYVAIVGSDPPICYGAIREADLARARTTREPAIFDQSGDPFVLVGPDEVVNDADVSALADRMRGAEPDFFGHLPEPAAIESAMRSPNPSVRAAAGVLRSALDKRK